LCFFFFTSGSPNASTFNCLITACSCSDGAILESVSRSALRLDFSDGGSSVIAEKARKRTVYTNINRKRIKAYLFVFYFFHPLRHSWSL
jgi:hypothetical protein